MTPNTNDTKTKQTHMDSTLNKVPKVLNGFEDFGTQQQVGGSKSKFGA